MRSEIKGLVCIGFLAFPVLLLNAQEVNQKAAPSEKVKELMKEIHGTLRANKPAKEVLGSLAAVRELTRELQSLQMQNELKFVMTWHLDPAVRREAATALGEVSRAPDTAPGAVAALTKMLDDQDIEVRLHALGGLYRLAPHSNSAGPEGLKLTKHKDARIRRTAYGFIGELAAYDSKLIPALIAGLDDPDLGEGKLGPGYGSVSMLVMMGLEKCKSTAKEAVPKLVEIVKGNKNDETYRSFAMRALIRIDPEHPLPMAVAKERLKQKDNPAELRKGASTLNFLGPHAKRAIPDLLVVLKMPPLADAEQERELKSAVLSAFGAMGPAATEVLPLLREMLSAQAQDSNIRASISNAIENIERKK